MLFDTSENRLSYASVLRYIQLIQKPTSGFERNAMPFARTLKTFILILFVTFINVLAFAVWEPVGDGIDYQYYRLSNPQNDAYVTRLDRSNESCIIDSSLGQGRISGEYDTWETVSGMAERYDGDINYWGQSWGQRNKVVAAINGDYYWTSPTHPDPFKSHSGQIQGGWFSRRYMEWSGGTGFVWKLDRTCFIGGNVTNGETYANPKQKVTFQNSTTANIDHLNHLCENDEIVVYGPQYGERIGSLPNSVEVLVELSRPLLPNVGVTGKVKRMRINSECFQVPFGHVVLAGRGSGGTAIRSNASVGSTVTFDMDIKDYSGKDWTKAYAGIGGHFYCVKNGTVPSSDWADNIGATSRHPRTCVAFNDDYVFFIVVDGRSGVSAGMSITELGNFCKDTLAARQAIAQDGGGSSTMVVNGQVMNVPSDGQERRVANGYMMINVLPMEKSERFSTGEEVPCVNGAKLRLGPDHDSGIVSTLSESTAGQIMENGLNGVLAETQYWWNWKAGTTEGWISQNDLTPKRDDSNFIQGF